jgi:hypothetical protein
MINLSKCWYVEFQRGVHDQNIINTMLSWDSEKKWLMIMQDHQAEMLAAGAKSQQGDDKSQQPAPLVNILKEKAGEMLTATIDAGQRAVERHSGPIPQGQYSAQQPTASAQPPVQYYDNSIADRNSPEFFIRKFMEKDLRAVSPSIAGHLEVSLRTRPLE